MEGWYRRALTDFRDRGMVWFHLTPEGLSRASEFVDRVVADLGVGAMVDHVGRGYVVRMTPDDAVREVGGAADAMIRILKRANVDSLCVRKGRYRFWIAREGAGEALDVAHAAYQQATEEEANDDDG